MNIIWVRHGSVRYLFLLLLGPTSEEARGQELCPASYPLPPTVLQYALRLGLVHLSGIYLPCTVRFDSGSGFRFFYGLSVSAHTSRVSSRFQISREFESEINLLQLTNKLQDHGFFFRN